MYQVIARKYRPQTFHDVVNQEHVKTTTAPYKYPRLVYFVDELPKTVSGKIRRTELRDRLRDGSL